MGSKEILMLRLPIMHCSISICTNKIISKLLGLKPKRNFGVILESVLRGPTKPEPIKHLHEQIVYLQIILDYAILLIV